MIEAVLINYLADALSIPVYAEVPKDAPERFVVIEKTGGGMENHIFESTFAIRSYGTSMLDAATTNEEVKGYMLYGQTPPEVCSVKLNSDYNYTDTSTKHYRYQAVYDIYHY